jgi:uncharacterized coiled-coil DUF342 family protein
MGLNHTIIAEVFEPKSEMVGEMLDDFKSKRDELNVKVRGQLDKRNEINRQVKELISEVQKQKTIRNEANGNVADLRKIRLEKTNELKELRVKLRRSKSGDADFRRPKNGRSAGKVRMEMEKLERRFETGQISANKEREFFSKMKKMQVEYNELRAAEEASSSSVLKEVRAAEKSQQRAHDAVTGASEKSEEAHALMIELSDEVDKLRGMANSEHIRLTNTKSEADILHNKYIISLRCIHSMQDILKLSGSKQKQIDEGERIDVTDLMSKLMSGDTLSTEELMLLQRS